MTEEIKKMLQGKAEEIYLSMTSYANYSQMNGTPKAWFIEKIKEGLESIVVNPSKYIKCLAWVRYQFPVKSGEYYTDLGKRYFNAEIKTWTNNEHSLIPLDYQPVEWLSESPQNCEKEKLKLLSIYNGALEKENDRLKEVCEGLYQQLMESTSLNEEDWQQFKTSNNL